MATLNIFTKFRYQAYHNDTVVESGTMYYVPPGTELIDCDGIVALFTGLTVAQAKSLLAQCSKTAPTIPTSYTVIVRDCANNDQIEVIWDNSGDPYAVTTGDGFDNSYTFTRAAATDYKGTPILLTPAPILNAVTQSKPRLTGNWYSFVPQSAQNAVIFKRIPPFTPHSSKILIFPGGLYTTDADNGFVGHGWTHGSESMKFPLDTYPTNIKRAIESANYQAAYQAANDSSATSAQKAKLLAWAGPLPAFEGNHLFIDDEASCQLYGKYWWQSFKQTDQKGAGVEYFSVNHEVYIGRTDNPTLEWYRQVGWLTKAIINWAALEGVTLKSGMTDWGNLSQRAPYFFDDIDNESGPTHLTGYPKYMGLGWVEEPYRGATQAAPIAGNTDCGALVLAGKAFVGVGRYLQHTSDGQSLFEKNSDGTLKVVSGNPVWRTDKRSATVTGQDTVIYKDDNFLAMIKRYGIEASHYANYFLRAGSVHLAASNVRGTGYENIRFSSQFRLDTEVQSGLTPEEIGLTGEEFSMLNSRPLYPNWVEDYAMSMYYNSDYIRGWMESQPQSAIGSNAQKARASAEIYAKGFHRAANFDWLIDTTYKPIEPKLWLKKQGIVSTPDDDEHFARKPIIRGAIATASGRRVLVIKQGVWPCQDEDRTTTVTIWVNKSGTLSPGYQFKLVGRQPFAEQWQLPVDFPDFDATDVRIQFHSLLDELITWTGDYRDAKITSHPTPPALA
ncbi:hypothetical protein [Spirosoma foliorum]|uniref:Uncharacterized protein n=1 Tax=Spirosoma foliorum TaxID=2710596 RepID=A0A7G5H2K6_9BACT|nr:hypothetical protein [Spirosoma foliorum]QMW05348.1 hypothetical protein H3H32_10885 [Spirosoma foliorum]